ncbi:hypothetical protein DL766_002002 [Monosporascus sp. MC13-8B]|uniref:C3H1-type domain-containing protein n=1 Tax=Monosporascus cannonballus TaxID=155416 RepID=A0ABY0HFC8_9PEZI|nr:hypothetical protein DL762_002313 [Monosporascus cannonballus]RYO94959.1 hypothetical protein DL763_003855 [Monosporascus cannonballus]RYP36340.1 hypothetical protein DL766_002002 [Monosporascus sp. MC13-8B]
MNPNHQQATVATNPDAGSGSGGGESSTDYRAMEPAAPAPSSRTQTTAPTTQQRQQQQSLPQPIPLPRYFLVRPGTVKHTASSAVTIPGPMVPLLPVDQLPEWMDVLGVPRELAVEQTAGLVNLGTVARGMPAFYEVYFHQQHDQQQYVRPRDGGDNDDSNRAVGSQKYWPEEDDGGVEGRLVIEDASSPSRISTSASSSLASASRMGPGAKSFASTKAVNRGGGNGKPHIGKTNAPNVNLNRSTSNSNTSDRDDPPPPQLPSPTVHGSSTSTSNQYLYYHDNNHTNDDGGGGGGHPLPPPSSPAHPHPADRMLAASAAASFSAPSRPHNPVHHQHNHDRRPPSSSAASKRRVGGGNPLPTSVYCRHWCHHGRCRWQGACWYAHAMPSTAEGLRGVGLGDYPAWWRAAVGMAFRMTGGGGGGHFPSPQPSARPHAHAHSFTAAAGGGGGPSFPPPPAGSSKRMIREWRETAMVMGWNPSAVGPPANAVGGGGGGGARGGAVRSRRERERDGEEGGDEHGRKEKGGKNSRSAVVDYLTMDEEELGAETVEGIDAPSKERRQTTTRETNALVEI